MRNGDERVTRELLAGEALYILRNLKDNKTGGRSNKLADVKATLEPTVTLEFDNYFFFLRKYNFIAMDREACLQLTAEGEKVLEAAPASALAMRWASTSPAGWAMSRPR